MTYFWRSGFEDSELVRCVHAEVAGCTDGRLQVDSSMSVGTGWI